MLNNLHHTRRFNYSELLKSAGMKSESPGSHDVEPLKKIIEVVGRYRSKRQGSRLNGINIIVVNNDDPKDSSTSPILNPSLIVGTFMHVMAARKNGQVQLT